MTTPLSLTSAAVLVDPLLQLTAGEALTALRKREISATDLTKAYMQRMDQTRHLNIYITPTPEQALADAAASDARWQAGEALALDGLPMAIKDAYCTKGVRTTAASRMLGNFVPPYESHVTSKMIQAGAVRLGKVNLDEFCMGSATTPVYTGKTLNPWDTARSAGGSSGGSAAAVASGSALLALGTDTGGSVRQPAAFCGIVGVQPTYGRCSRWGVVAFASSLDCPGPLARTVHDAALLLQEMAGYDGRDATCARVPVPKYTQALGCSVRGLRVGIPHQWYTQARMDEVVKQAWERAQDVYRQEGCELVPIELPHSPYALACYYIVACAEAASNLQRYDGVKYGYRASLGQENADVGGALNGNQGGPCQNSQSILEKMYALTRGQGFGPEVKRRILTGTYVLSHGYHDAFYGQAQRVRQLIKQDFDRVFQQVDVLLTPTAPTPAFSWDNMPCDPVAMYWNDIMTVPVNMGRACALSVPAGTCPQGMPLGMQIIAPAWHEERLFQWGHVLEKAMIMPALPLGA